MNTEHTTLQGLSVRNAWSMFPSPCSRSNGAMLLLVPLMLMTLACKQIKISQRSLCSELKGTEVCMEEVLTVPCVALFST